MTEKAPKNPYSVTTPVEDPSMFFGRKKELFEIIEKRIKHPHGISTILIGGRKIGKTSLLYQIRDRILNQSKCDDSTVLVPVYINLQECSSLDSANFFEHLISATMRILRQHWGLPVSLPEDVMTASYGVFRKRMYAILDQCSEHIGSVQCVILIDEAERLLGNPWTEDVISNLRDLINRSDLKTFVTLVITGFRELHDYSLMEKEGIGSPLGNAAYWTSLGVLAESECRDLITAPLEEEVSEEVIKVVYEQSGGHPFITQYLMQQVWRSNPADIVPADVVRASEQFCRKVKVFPSWQAKFTDLDKRVYEAVAQVQEPVAPSEIKRLVKGEAVPGEIPDSLHFLCYTGVISEQDKKYVIAGQLFRNWFLQRRQGRSKTMKDSKPQQGFDVSRLLVSALVVVLVFVVTVAVLVWAAQRVSPVALAFVLVVAVVFDLISIVSMLVLNDIVRPKWAMDFYNNVLIKVFPILKSTLPPRTEIDSEVAEELRESG